MKNILVKVKRGIDSTVTKLSWQELSATLNEKIVWAKKVLLQSKEIIESKLTINCIRLSFPLAKLR